MRMPAPAAAFTDSRRNQRALCPPSSLSWKQCGPKTDRWSRPQLRPELPGARLAAHFCGLRPLGARAPQQPGIICRASGPGVKGRSHWSCGLRSGWRLWPAKVTQHERRHRPSRRREEGAAQRAGRGRRLFDPGSSCPAPGLGQKPQESRFRACSDRARKLPAIRENSVIPEQNAPNRL